MAVLGQQKAHWRVWGYIYFVLGKIASSQNWYDIPVAYCSTPRAPYTYIY